MSNPKKKSLEPGFVGLGSWSTQVKFKDIRVTQDGKTILLDASQFSSENGNWEVKDGELLQTSLEKGTKRILKGFQGNDYTLELQACKTDGDEGFFVYFGMKEDASKGYFFNIAGWKNTKTAVEIVSGGKFSGIVGETASQSVETGKWYPIKVVGTPEKTALYMDEKLILEFEDRPSPLQFFASGYDEATGETILKVVNAEEVSYSAQFKLEGAQKIEKTGKVITLSSQSGEEENSFENPKTIYPTESEYKRFGKVFDYDFLPFSYTILRVKTIRQ
jgi:alpha-L-arabinofuranosidase